MSKQKTVTFGVIAYNEQNYITDLLENLKKQTYPHELIEVVLVDGKSTDDTWDILMNFKLENKNEFKDIKVLLNEKRNQPAGWNVVIKNSTADILLRIDAHAMLPDDFVEKNVMCINSGEYVCGGPRENVIDENTSWKRILLAAEQSMFGAGIASYRQETEEKKYVKSLFHAAYRREVIEKVGLFDERLIRTEDNEYHYRVSQEGFRICYDPQIHSFYQTRNTLKGMLKQKFLNGFWIGKTIFVCPKCISAFHLVPLAFVLAIVLTGIIAACVTIWPMCLLWIAYGLANILMTVFVILAEKRFTLYYFVLPFVFLGLHFGYGIGTIIGIVKGLLSPNKQDNKM